MDNLVHNVDFLWIIKLCKNLQEDKTMLNNWPSLRDYEQLKLLNMRNVLGLASDVAHAQISIYLNNLQERKLVIFCRETPETAFMYYQSDIAGSKLAYADEPLVTHSFESGLPVQGRRELVSGLTTNMYLLPLKWQGKVYAVLAFEYLDSLQCYPNQQIFMNAAIDLLECAEEKYDPEIYERLSSRDGIMLIDNNSMVSGVNNILQNIYLTMGVHRVVARRITERALHLDAVTDAYQQMRPAKFELYETKQVFAQRLIPICQGKALKQAILIMVDVTELKKRDQQLLVKSAVIKEIHHRVKNNLQTIASLLRIQSRKSKYAETKNVLKDCINQILSISVVHEFLSQQDQDNININIVARNIFELIIKNMVDPAMNLKAEFIGEDIILSSARANSISLVINEITQNAIEHAFVDSAESSLVMRVYLQEQNIVVELQDNGCGLPGDFCHNNSGGMGMQIIKTLVEHDLKGTFSLQNTEQGTLARVVFPQQ